MPNLIVGLGVAMPAFAESFPSNGYMLENKTYANAATEENMGAYDGTVTASAEYANTLYQIIGGTYLPAGAEVAAQCPANSYCPGLTDATYNASASQGAKTCPSGYPNSAVGASSNTQCYTACTVKLANIEHATAVSGNDYYGDGTDTCSATACENGYHVNETSKVITQRPLIDVDYTTEENVHRIITINGNGEPTTTIWHGDGWGTVLGVAYVEDNNTWAIEYGEGVVYGRASCQATPHDPGLEYIFANEGDIMDGAISPDQVRSDLTPIVGAAKANYTADTFAALLKDPENEETYEAYFSLLYVVFGLAKDASFSTTDTGGICYCQITGFQPASDEFGYDISRAVAVESAPWVYAQGNPVAQADGCASECTSACRTILATPYEFMYKIQRDALFGARDFVDGGTCDANEITIKWTDATDEDIAANNAGMCTYGGDIRTPVRAATKPGKTFVGWKFSK